MNYSSLEWRFQTQLASRSARDQLRPEVILKFQLKDQNNDTKHITISSDVHQLIRLHDQMESALSAARSQPLLKTVRKIK